MNKVYDAIVVGARCAGSPLAMLLARKGHRVLVVDRATFPSDTVSTHVLQPLAVEALERWGLADRLKATGCPSIHTYSFDFGLFTIAGSPGTAESPVAYCARRIVLDKLLVDAASEAGAEIREGFAVEGLVFEDGRVAGIKGRGRGGESVVERARVVIGADGRRSSISEAVGAPVYNERPIYLSSCFAYFSGLAMDGRFETYVREKRGMAAAPTHDGLTFVIAGWPYSESGGRGDDAEGKFWKAIEMAPSLAERVRSARRETKFLNAALPNFFRKPYGPGWALVGDAGYSKDPVTAQGIKDAFLDAERVAAALDSVFAGRREFEEVMEACRMERDGRAMPMYDLTCQIASLEPPPPEFQKLLSEIHGNREAMDRFVRMNAGTISPAEFFGTGG